MTAGGLDELVSREAIGAYHEALFFAQLAKTVELPQWYNTYQFTTVDSMTGTVASLTEGTVPTEVDFRLTGVDVALTGYGAWTKLSDKLLRGAPINAFTEASKELGFDLARKIDKVIQDTIDAGTNVIYSATEDASAGRTNIDDGDIFTANLLAQAVSRLTSNAALKFGDFFMCVMHPDVWYDFVTQTGTGTFIDVNKYAKPEQIIKGEVGALFGARIVVSPNVQKYANASDGAGSTGTVDVYPTYVFGRDAFGVVTAGGMETMIKGLGSGGTGDPLNQIASVGAKTYMGTGIIRQEGLYRIESSSSIGTNS